MRTDFSLECDKIAVPIIIDRIERKDHRDRAIYKILQPGICSETSAYGIAI